ncbi:hypothetical protein [uncultured Ruegeria sp.]|uniref:hypothetical protein n=1 Tax=uncultured Ruegeria sp. TaxID=259304 RepID=UPI002632D878|nr:hypothetical protein [uncultured Ruegeria sp.]
MIRSLSYAQWRAVFCGAAISAATLFNSPLATAQENAGVVVYEHEGVPLYGYISDPKIYELAQEIVGRYLASNSQSGSLKRANNLFTFIDPEIVSEGQFVSPEDLELSEEITDWFAQKVLRKNRCSVGRVFSTNENEKGDYFVWLVHSGGPKDIDDIEYCLLFAAAASAGILLADVPVVQSDDMRRLLDSIILGKK